MTDFNPIIIGTYNGQTVCRNMFNDRLFKYIFNNEKSKFITLNLINSLLMLEGENAYTDLTFCNSELKKLSQNYLSFLNPRIMYA